MVERDIRRLQQVRRVAADGGGTLRHAEIAESHEPNVAALREAALVAEAKTDAVAETVELRLRPAIIEPTCLGAASTHDREKQQELNADRYST